MGFFYETMYGGFSGPNKCGCTHEVAVLTKAIRQGSTVMKTIIKARVYLIVFNIFVNL